MGLFLAQLDKSGLLRGRVRLIFELAEELLPSGAVDVIEAGGIDGVDRIFAVHCWPHLPVGRFGVYTGVQRLVGSVAGKFNAEANPT